ENPAFLVACLDSVLAQTLLPKEIVIVIDGPITSKLQQVLDEYQSKSGLLRLLPQKENKGLGYTLAIGVEACQYELVARMDTDDLMLPTRLEE
ncbi:glycosyltransferase, partial [Vibrio parahaemolyticus]